MLGIGLELTGCGLGGGGSSGVPSLDLNFLTMTADTLDSRVTFSRASLAWQYDSTGTLVTVPHNLLPNSDMFANSAWTKTQSTVSGNVLANPLDSAVTADKLIENSATNVHDIKQTYAGFLAGNQYTLSFYAKADTRDRVRVFMTSAAFGVTVTVRFLLTGAGSLTVSTAGTNGSSSITAVGASGWYRCMVSAQATTTASADCLIRLENGAGADNFAGDGTSGLYLYGAQLSQHTALRSYISTSVKNMLGFSEQFDNAAWTKTRVTVTANAVLGPSPLDAATNADKVVEATDVATNRQLQQTVSVVSGTTYALSVYAKAAERSGINLRFGSGFAAGNVTFDLSAGTLTSSGAVASSSITSIGSGWYRCFCAFVATSSTSAGAQVFLHNGSSITYDGVAGNGVYLFGAQVSPSGSLDTYVPTIAAAPSSAAYHGPAFGYDPAALTARGLRSEEARTNLTPGLVSNSTYWTALASVITQGATAPDGNATAFTITCNAGGVTSYGANLAAASIPTITAGAMTASLFVKAGSGGWFRLIMSDATTPTIGAQCYFNTATGALGTVGTQSGAPSSVSAVVQTISNGWYRISLTATLGAATTATMLLRLVSANGVTTDVGSSVALVFNPQLEVGGFATSPILTSTTTVARSADLCSINPLGSWFNATEGTLFMEGTRYTIRSSTSYVVLTDGTSNNTIGHVNGVGTPAQQRSDVVVGGANQAQFSYTSAATVDTVYKEVIAYKLNDFAGSMNGSAVSTDSSGTIPTVDRMTIGTNGVVSVWLGGYIRKIKYWNTRRANGELPNITT